MSEWADVILFRRSGKYYTQERWRIPEVVKDWSSERGHFERKPIGPYDMAESVNFRRIDGGAVLIEAQEPWGYPHLFPGLPPGQTDEPTETDGPKFIRSKDGVLIAVQHIVTIGPMHPVTFTHNVGHVAGEYYTVSNEEIARIVQ